MKKSMLVMVAITAILFTNCTPSSTLDAVDEFNNLECLNKLLKLSQNEDDISCSELVKQLNSLKNSCGDVDGDIQEAILLIQSSCED